MSAIRAEVEKSRRTDQLAVNLQVSKTQEWLDIRVLKRDEPEALAAPGLPVQHDRGVDDFAELREELAHGLRGDAAREAADEQLRRTLVLLAGNRTLRIDLQGND